MKIGEKSKCLKLIDCLKKICNNNKKAIETDYVEMEMGKNNEREKRLKQCPVSETDKNRY